MRAGRCLTRLLHRVQRDATQAQLATAHVDRKADFVCEAHPCPKPYNLPTNPPTFPSLRARPCDCGVRRHSDGTFAVTELCQGHLDELQDEADERARALLGE